jgi:SAM-dependent methyltransferase
MIDLGNPPLAKILSEADLVVFGSSIFPPEPVFHRFINEARFGLSRVLPILADCKSKHPRILELGAGSCLLAAYLASKQFDVTALEPLGPEFDFFADPQRRVLEYCQIKSIALNLIRTTGEQLDLPAKFDIVFTINALEHMRDPLLTIDNMCNSLRPGGVALVHCPNYTIPFDVHFNVVLITRSKGFNAWLYRSRIARYPKVWDELNFIRYTDLRRHLAKRGIKFEFDRSVMRDLVQRLMDDPIFAQRMPVIVRVIGATLRYTGLIRALVMVPVRFQTPMQVLIRRC